MLLDIILDYFTWKYKYKKNIIFYLKKMSLRKNFSISACKLAIATSNTACKCSLLRLKEYTCVFCTSQSKMSDHMYMYSVY